MAEDVYAKPDLTKVRYRREREQETEDRGEREERIVDIYVSADDRGLDPGSDPDPDPGTQQDVVQQNAAQAQHGASGESKKSRSRVVAVCLCLLFVILLAVIIGLARNNSECPEERNNLNHLQSKYNNLTKVLDIVTAERDELKRRLCGPGWQAFIRGCYYISTEKKTWDQSRQWCRDNQSDLIIINSKKEQYFVNKNVDGWTQNTVWLGLTDREEGVWKWIDGTPLTSTPTYWRHGEPSDNGNCAMYYEGLTGLNDGWNVAPCTETKHWMCEKVL